LFYSRNPVADIQNPAFLIPGSATDSDSLAEVRDETARIAACV
jgi:hypothetical protein